MAQFSGKRKSCNLRRTKLRIMQLPNISRNYKILIGAIVLLAIIAFTALKTNLPKKLLDYINEDLIKEQEALKKENDQIRNEMMQDSIEFQDALNAKAIEVEAFRFKYNNSLKTIRRYEKALNDYNVGDFPNNFGEFTINVTSADTLSIDGFNVDNQN